MVRIPYLLLSVALALLLSSCGQSKSNSSESPPSENRIQLFGAKVAPNISALPDCDSVQLGQLFYVIGEDEFQFCATDGYRSIDLRGATGDPGRAGNNGADGLDGAPGSGCTLNTNPNGTQMIFCDDGTSANIQDGKSCLIESNSDGSYDLTCSGVTVTVRNGRDGLDGKNGTNGIGCTATKSRDTLIVKCSDVTDTIIDGKNGATGADGEDGTSCTVSDDGNGMLTQTCGSTSVSWPKALCGTEAYDPGSHFCSKSGNVVEMCEGAVFDPETHYCSSLTEITELSPCGDSVYNPETHFCDEEQEKPMEAWSEHCLVPGNCGTFTDTREERIYRWTKIGSQIWMAENLAYLPLVNTITETSVTEPRYYVYGNLGQDLDVAKSLKGYQVYGALYNWAAAITLSPGSTGNPNFLQGVCPDEWHLSTEAEWIELQNFAGGPSIAGQKLKSPSEWAIAMDIINEDSFGFSALPSGYFINAGFTAQTTYAVWWTATTASTTESIYSLLSHTNATTHFASYTNSAAFAVRCVKNPVVN